MSHHVALHTDSKLFCVLQIMRNVNTTERMTGKNHYALRVLHGTDCAVMIAFCVVIDELFND